MTEQEFDFLFPYWRLMCERCGWDEKSFKAGIIFAYQHGAAFNQFTPLVQHWGAKAQLAEVNTISQNLLSRQRNSREFHV